jgi:Fur family ferric uptake transcriptional regulator
LLHQAYDLLKKYNFRITPQRKAILQILHNYRGHHLETEDIYELLVEKEEKNKKIGLATVYRTMELFEKIGLVSRLPMENSPARYELISYDQSGHHHLICLKCREIQEINDENIQEFKEYILKDKDFKIADKSMKIYGYCSKCRNM